MATTVYSHAALPEHVFVCDEASVWYVAPNVPGGWKLRRVWIGPRDSAGRPSSVRDSHTILREFSAEASRLILATLGVECSEVAR